MQKIFCGIQNMHLFFYLFCSSIAVKEGSHGYNTSIVLEERNSPEILTSILFG